jgi:hypothetical protein
MLNQNNLKRLQHETFLNGLKIAGVNLYCQTDHLVYDPNPLNTREKLEKVLHLLYLTERVFLLKIIPQCLQNRPKSGIESIAVVKDR